MIFEGLISIPFSKSTGIWSRSRSTLKIPKNPKTRNGMMIFEMRKAVFGSFFIDKYDKKSTMF